MDLLSQIIISVVPAVVVLFVSFFLIKYQLERVVIHATSDSSKSRGANRPHHVNFQAYERLVMYLERINPGNMVLRMHKGNASAKMLEAEMVKAIREEFEHNLSQQIYFSDEIWSLIKGAKEETVKLIGLAASQCTNGSSAMDLSRILMEMTEKMDKFPHDVAIHYLKEELRQKVG